MKEKKDIVIDIVLLGLFVLALYWSIEFISSRIHPGDVALFNLPVPFHLFLVNLVWPLSLSIILVFLFPLILVPFFLKLKNGILYKYKNAYVGFEKLNIDGRKVAKRFIYIFLLSFGLSATLINIGVVNMRSLISDTTYFYWVIERGAQLEFVEEAVGGLLYLIVPVVVGIWSIGWVLQDSGLMHYKLPEEREKVLYEIEPIHLKYNSIIKGYAGITAIAYYINLVAYYINFGDLSQLLLMSLYGFITSCMMIPSYLLYWYIFRKYLTKRLRKNLKEVPIISKSQFETE